MSADRLSEIKARAEAATPEDVPWLVSLVESLTAERDAPGAGVSGGTVMGGDAEIARLRSVLADEIARRESAEAEVRRLTEFRDWWKASSLANAEDVRRLTAICHDWRDRSEAAEAEVGTLRARLAAVEALHWKVGGACSHCSQRSDYAVAWPCETAVALAGTTGEGE